MVQSFLFALLATSPFLHLIEASPAPKPRPSPGRLDDLLKYGLPEDVDLDSLIARGMQASSHTLQRRKGLNQDALKSNLPSCDEDGDPSYAVGTSKYQDGEGIIVKDGVCDNGLYTFKNHCWSTMFFTHVQIEYSDWENTGGIIDCGTTSVCQLQSISLNQSCTSDTASWDNAIQFGAEAKLDEIKATKWGIGGSFSYQHNFGGSQTVLTCNANSDVGSCSWDDRGCHAIWKGKRNRRIFGYMRRNCDKGREGTNLSYQRADGYWTIGMLDFEYVVPDNQAIGCQAMCGDVTYPDPKLGGNDQKLPWPGVV